MPPPIEIRDTPDLCAVGDAVYASNAPGFDSSLSSFEYRHETRHDRDASKDERLETLPPDEIWIFVRATYRVGSGDLEAVWVREK